MIVGTTMKLNKIMLAIPILALSVYLIYSSQFLVGLILLIVPGYLIYRDVRVSVANRNISSITYNSIVESGLARIDGGSTKIDRSRFTESMVKIRDILEKQQFVPEIGYDSVHLQYSNESSASADLNRIREQGLNAEIMQDKSGWRIRIIF